MLAHHAEASSTRGRPRALRVQHALMALLLLALAVRSFLSPLPAQTTPVQAAQIQTITTTRAAQQAPPLVPGTPQFGLNTHLLWDGPNVAAADLDRIVAAGQTVVRFDVQWDGFEPTEKGGWNEAYLAHLDQTLGLVEQRGLRPILVILGTPAWARSGTGTRLTPPDRVEDFADAVGFLAARYADHPTMAYEIWNEPNQDDFWVTPAGADPIVYARMLKASYASIKAAAPNAIVLGGSIAFNDHDYFEQMYRDGDIGASFDALALHPYSLEHAPDQVTDQVHSFTLAIDTMSTVMAMHGEPNKPIWLTEIGWSTKLVGESVRADFYRRAVDQIRQRPQVAVAIAYQLRQDQDLPEFGLISETGAPTISWTAYVQAVGAPGVPGQPRGAIDGPAENATVSGTITLTGWAIDEAAAGSAGIDRVQVGLSGTDLGTAEIGQQRPDIASAYGPAFGSSGYRYTLDLSRAAPGPHTIEVRAHSTVSGYEMAYVRAITITP